MIGQALGLPPAMTIYSFIGVAVTSASVILFGQAIWDPVALLGALSRAGDRFDRSDRAADGHVEHQRRSQRRLAVERFFQPESTSDLVPHRWHNHRRNGRAHDAVEAPHAIFSSYIFGWLVGYSGLLGPIAGIMITDYFLLRHTNLDVGELYNPVGIYRYGSGVNYRAIVALAAGVVVALIGLLVPPLRWLYDYAWFVGFLVASLTYWFAMRKSAGKNVVRQRTYDHP